MPAPYFPSPPPKDALEWFRAKGLKLGFDYRDVWREEHAIAFTVTKIMQLDLLADVRTAVDQALADGLTFQTFKKRLTPILQEKGWWGVKEMVDPLTGETKQVQLGSPRRLRVIYDTNLRTARAAGQWERIQRTKESLPYLLYTVGPSREHRPEHLNWHGTLLPVDDPFWKTHAPPSGWGCRCRIRQVSHREYAQLLKSGIPAPPSQATQEIDSKTGLPTGRRLAVRVPVKTTAPKTSLVEWTNKRTGDVQQVPKGIDPGWDYNPGEGRQAHLEKVLAEKKNALFKKQRVEDMPAWIRSATTQQAEREALKLGAKSVDYQQSLTIANEVNAALDELHQRGVAIPDHLRIDDQFFRRWAQQLGAVPVEFPAAFVPSRQAGETYLFANPLYQHWGQLSADAAQQYQRGQWSTSHPYHVIRHEMGHFVYYRANPARYLAMRTQRLTAAEQQIASGVSAYAATSVMEFIAETFAVLVDGKALPATVLALYARLGGVHP